jgi:light-regulated signal transduction histidine kinase (bacteriophytochrome)
MDQGALLNRMTNRIRQSLELPQVLSATVTEMRSFLKTDRVKVYRFQSDGTGQVIAESVDENRLPALLGLHFPASDIPPHAREMFVKARTRSVVDIPAQQITLSRLDCFETTGDLTVKDVHEQPIGDILQRPVDPCHVEYLTTMGVQSSLVVPILEGQNLWGLLASHHAQPKAFSEKHLKIVQMFADQVSIAISQSNLLFQAREQARREALINEISTLLHSPIPIQEILQIVLERLVKAVDGSGGRLYLKGINESLTTELYTCGVQPVMTNNQLPLLETYPFWQQIVGSAEKVTLTAEPVDGQLAAACSSPILLPYVVTDIYQEPSLTDVASFFRPTANRSLLTMPLCYARQPLGCLSIFRKEIDTDIVWAGRFDPDERHYRVRNSFEAWRELKLGQAREWTKEELEIVQALSTHLTMAVMQNRLYQWEHQQRLLVEMRNAELKAARVVAEEANRLKSDFLSSTSHELRTPLASTLNYLKLLNEGFYDSEEELKEYLSIAHQSASNLVAIINDVLDLAKIEAGRMHVEFDYLNLPELLEEQCGLFRPESRRKEIPLIIECELETVYADLVKLRQVLTNLISNAFKFTTQGEIRVNAVPHDSSPNFAKISVTDTGIGVNPIQQERLFEPFVQADGSVKRRYGGTGLGLTVCKRLVELMGGEIGLHSAGQGQGTTVSFMLRRKGEGERGKGKG